MSAPEVRVAVDKPALLGESPLWHPQQQALWYCDIPARRLLRFDPASGAQTHHDFHTDIGSFAPTRDGRFIVALRDGLWRFDPASDERTQLAVAPYDPSDERFNDGKCDPAGRFWVGSIDEPRRPGRAGLWCYADGVLERRQSGITVSNGLAWSPDSRTMYWSDTAVHTVWAFDYEPLSAAMTRRRVFAEFPPKPAQGLVGYGGRPDGATVDSEGCYWVAMYEGGRVLRLSPAGELLAEVRVPARCPTMPCFGDADLKTVYVTSASVNRPPDEVAEFPHPGCVFSFRVAVPGRPVDFAALS
jgi:sugar lactone lactonase YvrE